MTPTTDTREVASRTCELFDFETANGKAGTVKGTVCLAPETGSPPDARFAPSRLPKHRVLQSTVIRFADDGPLGWRPVALDRLADRAHQAVITGDCYRDERPRRCRRPS